MLITTGHPIGVMATERPYENFIIELDWRHMEYAGNSGLYIWGEPMPAPGVPFSKGIEVQTLTSATRSSTRTVPTNGSPPRATSFRSGARR